MNCTVPFHIGTISLGEFSTNSLLCNLNFRVNKLLGHPDSWNLKILFPPGLSADIKGVISVKWCGCLPNGVIHLAISKQSLPSDSHKKSLAILSYSSHPASL